MNDIKEFAEKYLHCDFGEFRKAMSDGKWMRIHKFCWERINHIDDGINFLAIFAGDIPLIGWNSEEVKGSDHMFVYDVEIRSNPEGKCSTVIRERYCMIENHYCGITDTHLISMEEEDGDDITYLTEQVRKGNISSRLEDGYYSPFESTVPQYITEKNEADTIEYFRKEKEACERTLALLDR